MRFRVGNERSQMRFSDVNLLDFPNAFDLHLNVWPPECVVHDTDPPQLLRSNCYLPMDSLVGMSIEWVNVYTWHDLSQYLQLTVLYKMHSLNILCPRPQSFNCSPDIWNDTFLMMHSIFRCQWTLPKCTICDLPTNTRKTRRMKQEQRNMDILTNEVIWHSNAYVLYMIY